MKNIEKVMSITEASKRWGIAKNKIYTACAGNKANPSVKILFTSDEMRQSGGVWLVTIKGMERVFGPEPIHNA